MSGGANWDGAAPFPQSRAGPSGRGAGAEPGGGAGSAPPVPGRRRQAALRPFAPARAPGPPGSSPRRPRRRPAPPSGADRAQRCRRHRPAMPAGHRAAEQALTLRSARTAAMGSGGPGPHGRHRQVPAIRPGRLRSWGGTGADLGLEPSAAELRCRRGRGRLGGRWQSRCARLVRAGSAAGEAGRSGGAVRGRSRGCEKRFLCGQRVSVRGVPGRCRRPTRGLVRNVQGAALPSSRARRLRRKRQCPAAAWSLPVRAVRGLGPPGLGELVGTQDARALRDAIRAGEPTILQRDHAGECGTSWGTSSCLPRYCRGSLGC